MTKFLFVLLVLSTSAAAQPLPPARGLPPQGNLPGRPPERPQEPVLIAPPPVYYSPSAPRETRCWWVGSTFTCR